MLAEVAAGGAIFRSLVRTRNRRVMVSTGDGGRTLRLNERFLDAPDAVLRAIGRLLSGRSGGAARALVRAFLRDHPPGPPVRRARRIRPVDRAEVERLRAEFDRVNGRYFAGALPAVPILISGRMRRRNGHFSTSPVEIVISRTLCRDAVEGEAERTLRHEMIHLWQHAQGVAPGHGRDFRTWAARLDVHPRATRPVRWKADELSTTTSADPGAATPHHRPKHA